MKSTKNSTPIANALTQNEAEAPQKVNIINKNDKTEGQLYN